MPYMCVSMCYCMWSGLLDPFTPSSPSPCACTMLFNPVHSFTCVQAAVSLDASLARLSAKRLLPVALGDQNVAESKCGSIEADFTVWKASLLKQLVVDTSDHKSQSSRVLSASGGAAKQVI